MMSCSPPLRRDHRQHAGQGVELAHDRRRAAQVADGLEQRHDDQVGHRVLRQRAAQQPGLLQQQQHLEQVADLLGVADDAVADRAAAEARDGGVGGLEDRQFAARNVAVVGAAHAQRAGVVEQAPAAARAWPARPARCSRAPAAPRAAVRRPPLRVCRELWRRSSVARWKPKTCTARCSGASRGAIRRRAWCERSEASITLQVGGELVGAGIGILRRHRMAQRLGAGQRLQRGRQAGVDADQRPPVGFVGAVRAAVGRAFGQRLHRRRHRRQQGRHRQLRAELVHFGQVVAQHQLALPGQRLAQRRGGDVGVAVAVAADPVAHAQKGGHRLAGQRLLDLAVQARDLAQEGAGVEAQRVLDLVGHRQPGGAQHARLPQLGDAGADQRLVLGQFPLAAQAVARAHQLGDRTLGVEDALALHLGRVRGQHRRDVGPLQHRGDVRCTMPGALQALEAHRQRAFLQVTGVFVHAAPAHMVPVLGDVGQVREVAEGADHADRLVDADRFFSSRSSTRPALGVAFSR